MELLWWNNLPVDYNSIKSNKLFYNQYSYRGEGFLRYVRCIRDLNHDTVGARLQMRENIETTLRSGYFHADGTSIWAQENYEFDKPVGKSSKSKKEIENNLRNFLDILLETNSEFKTTFYRSKFYIYTNDNEFLKNLLTANGVKNPKVTESIVSYPSDVIIKRKSDYSYRCYLKDTLIGSSTVKDTMLGFFDTHWDDINVSKSFQRWFANEVKYTRNHFFFDFNNPHLELMFELTFPGLLRRKYRIIENGKNARRSSNDQAE